MFLDQFVVCGQGFWFENDPEGLSYIDGKKYSEKIE